MKLFAAVTFLVALATASPVEVNSSVELHPRDEGGSLAKRDTEIIYLTNCVSAVSCCSDPVHYSQIAYYAASGASQNLEYPGANNLCSVTSTNYVWWEQDNNHCSFPTGVTVTTHLDSGAGSYPLYSWSGWLTNGYKNFNCYRDNGRKVYESSGPEWAKTCTSVYYCIPQ